MTKGEFLEIIQSDLFKSVMRSAVEPDITTLRDEMRDFRDQVLTREDATVRELKGMRQELVLIGARVTRLEESRP